jgi:putative endopeptidase
VLQIETRLAKASMSRLEMRDPQKTYNKMRIEELVSASPSFAWPDYLAKRGFGELDSLNVGQPLFFKEISAMIESIPVADWQTYCRWNLVKLYAAYLNKAFVDQDFHFYGTVLSGRKAQRPRWKRVLAPLMAPWAKLWANSMWKSIFRPQPKAECSNWSPTLKSPSANASRCWTG